MSNYIDNMRMTLSDKSDAVAIAYFTCSFGDSITRIGMNDLVLCATRDHSRVWINFPSEPNRVPCIRCRSKNKRSDKYCSTCGLMKSRGEDEYKARVMPLNEETRLMILNAAIDEYERLIGAENDPKK